MQHRNVHVTKDALMTFTYSLENNCYSEFSVNLNSAVKENLGMLMDLKTAA